MRRLSLLLAFLVGCSNQPDEGGRKIPAPVPLAGYEKKGDPKPGEWLSHFPEPGQSFDAYVENCANLRTEEPQTIYIQPLGKMTERETKALTIMGDYAEIFFGVPTKVLPERKHFDNGYVKERDQWNASMVIGQLAEIRPDDAIVFVGITNADLFSRELNFVFGVGSLRNRCGIYSLLRYRTADDTLFLRRALKLMTHEVGHIFSVKHCIEYMCVMNGANHLDEDDSHPMYLCPDDLRKLEWNLGFDRMERYRKLLNFYEKHGLEPAERWTGAQIKRLGG